MNKFYKVHWPWDKSDFLQSAAAPGTLQRKPKPVSDR